MKWLIPCLFPISGIAGSFPDDDGIEASLPAIWGAEASITPGPVDITVPNGAFVNYGLPSDLIGPSDAGDDVQLGVVSLGDGGSATIRFATPVRDGPGADLAVFENGFSSSFLELAHVEVSSNGRDFVCFPSISETPNEEQIGAFTFGIIDPTELHNLAGKYEAGIGTPFDLSELQGRSPKLDISHITHVRVIDVVGSIDPRWGTRDSTGRLINDPFKTNFNTGGFDLDAIGALHQGFNLLADWQAYHFPDDGDSSDSGDPDRDGIPNLVEYALASDPSHPSPQPIRLDSQASGTTLQWDRSRNRNDVTLRLQGSDQLSTWTTLAESIHGAETVAVAPGVTVLETSGTTNVVATVPSNFTFFRFRAD